MNKQTEKQTSRQTNRQYLEYLDIKRTRTILIRFMILSDVVICFLGFFILRSRRLGQDWLGWNGWGGGSISKQCFILVTDKIFKKIV